MHSAQPWPSQAVLFTCRQLSAALSTALGRVGLKGASWQWLGLYPGTGKGLLCFFLLPACRDRYFCLWSLSSVFFLLSLNSSLPISSCAPTPRPPFFATSSFFPRCTVWHRRRREPHHIKECNHKSCLGKQGPRFFFFFFFFFANLPFLDLFSHNQILPIVLTMWWCVNTLEFCFNQRPRA